VPPQQVDVAVVGAGIVGLAVAWRARDAGLEVRVLDRGPLGAGTSHAAGGMLAPVSEADAGEPGLLALGRDSLGRWPAFAAELEAASGVAVGLRETGTLLVARDADEAAALERERALRERLGVPVARLLPSAARRLEPALAPALRLALEAPGDHAVDPRATVAALAEACRRTGVDLRPHTDVPDPRALDAGRVVLATGAWAGGPVRPVKGQALILRGDLGLGRTVRWDGGYLVPRGDGRFYLGATMEERGFDTSVTAWGIFELLRDASELVPGVLELEVLETFAGLRPGTPDNAPVIGPDPADPRLVWAAGHHRNGVLLAPLTADLVLDELLGRAAAHPFGPGRFATVGA
jgi:glycine oxidase